jgi:hypothetical protein
MANQEHLREFLQRINPLMVYEPLYRSLEFACVAARRGSDWILMSGRALLRTEPVESDSSITPFRIVDGALLSLYGRIAAPHVVRLVENLERSAVITGLREGPQYTVLLDGTSGECTWMLPTVRGVDIMDGPRRWGSVFSVQGDGPDLSASISPESWRRIEDQLRSGDPGVDGFDGLCGRLRLPARRGNLRATFELAAELPARFVGVDASGDTTLNIEIECGGAPQLTISWLPQHEFLRVPNGWHDAAGPVRRVKTPIPDGTTRANLRLLFAGIEAAMTSFAVEDKKLKAISIDQKNKENNVGLNYPGEWKFSADGVSDVPATAVNELFNVLLRVAGSSESPKAMIERFKSTFANFNGDDYEASSLLEYAREGLFGLMTNCATNAATFIDAYWACLSTAREAGLGVPSVSQVNAILRTHAVLFEISPPNLLRVGGDAILIEEGTPKAIGANDGPERYTLGAQLGRGGFGTVYQAKRSSSIASFEFAIKVLDPSSFVEHPQRARERFIREVQAVQRLQHRGIVPFVDAGLDIEGRPYLVMPKVDGSNLWDACGPQRVEEVMSLMLQVLEALEYAHQNNVLHRDLKPSNILVRRSDRQPLIVDFGQAYLFDEMRQDSLTSSGLVGSLGYIPPEVIANPKERSVLHDIYSCGVIVYELIARRRPDASDYKRLITINADCVGIDPVVLKALGPARSRFRSAGDFREALLKV